MRPTPLYLLTWTSLLFSLLIFITGVLDLGLWMNMSAAGATILYHLAVLIISARTRDLKPLAIFTSIPTAGCASILVFGWLAALAMTILVLVIGRDGFPGPPPLVSMPFPVHVAQATLTGVETAMMVIIAKLSGYPHVTIRHDPTRAQFALQQRISLHPSSTRRLLAIELIELRPGCVWGFTRCTAMPLYFISLDPPHATPILGDLCANARGKADETLVLLGHTSSHRRSYRPRLHVSTDDVRLFSTQLPWPLRSAPGLITPSPTLFFNGTPHPCRKSPSKWDCGTKGTRPSDAWAWRKSQRTGEDDGKIDPLRANIPSMGIPCAVTWVS
ncbi:hypothetical protein DFH07DRAFT_765622 [Mycena maculata]|uniref:Uncharacterized protein n=1 Tax=Mycena maculata TaxID=230809 RepID=A0AAD7KAY8_9AGAR|nr:hypothetical protein DFH07DRAFT_765622 [Mycena maculata]